MTFIANFFAAVGPHNSVALLVAALAVVAVVRLVLCHVQERRRRGGLPYPPGPPAEPILGHLRVIPADNPEYTYMRWSREYGSDILGFHILGQPVIVLNSARAAGDLLDRRGANYADRPRFVLFEAMGWSRTLTFLRVGPAFRLHRRILQKRFQKSAITVDQPLQMRETAEMLRGLARSPERWEAVLRRFATAVVMGIGFGIHITDDENPYIQIASDASYALGHGGAPAGTPVDYFPALMHLPNWLVDRSLRFARAWRFAIRKIHDVPYRAITSSLDASGGSSLIHNLLDQRRAQLAKGAVPDLEEDDIKGAAAAVYAAGQDTTWATLIVLVLNMVLHPDVQAKAQAALDAHLGDRLPTFADRTAPELRYLEYLVYETLRWCPVSPVGVPHRAVHDDEYQGYFIPAGAYVYANARAITHDPAVYQDPDNFDPTAMSLWPRAAAASPCRSASSALAAASAWASTSHRPACGLLRPAC